MKPSMFYRSQDTNWNYQNKSYNNQNIKTVFSTILNILVGK